MGGHLLKKWINSFPKLPSFSWHQIWFLLHLLRLLFRDTEGRPHLPPQVPGECITCPYFINTPHKVSTSQGVPANLTCGVRNVFDKQVSWIRKADLHVLSTGSQVYTSDSRFRVHHVDGSPFWTLEVLNPSARDSGIYECQVSTMPKIFRRIRFDVTDHKETEVINTGTRGGIQLVTDRHQGTSWLLVNDVTWRDAGNYTCRPELAKPAIITVHVIDEETPAAMQPELLSLASVPFTPCVGKLTAMLICCLVATKQWQTVVSVS